MNKYIIGLVFTLYSGSMIQTMPKATTSSQSQTHPCPYPGCTKSYKNRYNLHNHIDVKHKNIRYKCSYEGCDKEYSRNSTLDNHIDAEHKNLKHKCSYEGCNREYKEHSRLKNHINIEHKNIRYKCSYERCNKEYKDNSGLNYHINSIHKKIRRACPYKECTQSFARKDHLTKHINKIHKNAPSSDNDSNNNSDNNNLSIQLPDNQSQELVNEIDNNDNELSPAALLEQFNIALDVDNIELAEQLIETASIDEINTLKNQLLYAIIMKNKMNLIAALNNKN